MHADPTLSPPDLARRYGCKAAKIISWIRSGELDAVNVAAKTTGRPRWRIPAAAVEAFETRRSAIPKPAKPARRRSKVNRGDWVEYF